MSALQLPLSILIFTLLLEINDKNSWFISVRKKICGSEIFYVLGEAALYTFKFLIKNAAIQTKIKQNLTQIRKSQAKCGRYKRFCFSYLRNFKYSVSPSKVAPQLLFSLLWSPPGFYPLAISIPLVY